MRALISNSCRLVFRARKSTPVSIVCIRKSYFSSACVDETISLPIGNNGAVTLRVTRPDLKNQDGPAVSRSSGSNVILYLPPGPLFAPAGVSPDNAITQQTRGDETQDFENTSIQQVLASSAGATVVTVEYRLGKITEEPESAPEAIASTSSREIASTSQHEPRFYQYPTPIHDTIAGFDWIQNNLQPAQLGIFGSHIGGSLALMLALTEAQSIKAVAAADPVCDWPSLDEYCIRNSETTETPRRGSKRSISKQAAPHDLVPLLNARRQLFSSFERCFDAFASPILFLRSAGRDVPKSFPEYLTGEAYPVPVLKESWNTTSMTSAERESSIGSSDISDVDGYLTGEEDWNQEELPPTRRRKALSRWPPYGLDYGLGGNTWSGPGHGVRRLEMTLPWVRVFSGMDQNGRDTGSGSTVLARQSEEMVSVLRRACFFGREKGYGERRVTLSHADDRLGEEAGKWLGGPFDGSLKDE